MSDIVKYQNDLNSYPIFKLTEVEQDLFMTLLALTSFEEDQWIITNLYDLKEKSRYWRDSLKSIKDEINGLLAKICDTKMQIETDKTVHIFTCFDELIYDKETDVLKLHVQNTFFQLIKNYKLGFTRFELAEFVSLSGSYTKTIYRFLKQHRTQGVWLVPIEDFRRLLCIPESYKMCDIDKQVLNPALKQLSRKLNVFDPVRIPFKKLKVEKIKKTGRGARGRGGVITALKFTFDAEKIKEVPEEKKTITSAVPKAAKPAQIPTAQAVKSPFKAEESEED